VAAFSQQSRRFLDVSPPRKMVIRTPNIFSTQSKKCAGKIFCGRGRAIATIFRGDFAPHFHAKKKPPRIC